MAEGTLPPALRSPQPISVVSGLYGPIRRRAQARRRNSRPGRWLPVVVAGLALATVSGILLRPGILPSTPAPEIADRPISIVEAIPSESAFTPVDVEPLTMFDEFNGLGDTPIFESLAPEPRGLNLTRYIVEPGDTVRDLAVRFGISNETIIWANDLANADLLSIGELLEIPPISGVLHRVRPGDTVADLSVWYDGKTQDVIEANALVDPYIIVVGQPLLVPGGRVPRPVAPEISPDQSGVQAATTGIRALPALPIPPGATTAQQEFILTHARAAQRSQQTSGVPASVTLAQAILETYWGSSRLAREANNFFGIKAYERTGSGGVIWFDVWEHIRGRDVVQHAPFRKYTNVEESFIDHGQWFHAWPRYAGALAARANPRQFAREIAAAGYATDPAYAAKLIALMDRFQLYAYDLD